MGGGGRKLVILTDQNFGAILPMEGKKCPIVVRVEGGWLHEIGDAFLELMDEHTLPEGSVILLGSLSNLMKQGSAGHAKALCREVRRFSGLFQGSATVIPFSPPPIFGTNDTSLVMAISDVTNWLDSVQTGNFMDYNSVLRAQIRASIWEKNPESQLGDSIEYPPPPPQTDLSG
jgi:hypothetical protein